MKILLKLLFLFFSFLSLQARAENVSVHFQMGAEAEQALSGKPLFKIENDIPLVFVSITVDLNENIKSLALAKGDENIPLLFVQTGRSTNIFLPVSEGKIQIEWPDVTTTASFHIDPVKNYFVMAKNCQKTLAFRALNPAPSPFISAVICKYQKNDLSELIFSTMADGEWLGSDIFENSGKGERWKVFAGKDFTIADAVTLSWGPSDSPNKVVIRKKKVPVAKVERNLFSIEGGLGFSSLNVQTSTASGGVSGESLFVRALFFPGRGFWHVGAEYQTLILASATASGTPSYSEAKVFGGYEYIVGNWAWWGQAGYLSQSLSVPAENMIVSINSPLVRGLGVYKWSDSLLQAGYAYATTSSGSSKGNGGEASLRYYFKIKSLDVFGGYSMDSYSYTNAISKNKSSIQSLQFGVAF